MAALDSKTDSQTQSKVIVALDFDNQQAALSLVEKLDPTQCRVKVGKELFTAAGPGLVKGLVDSGFDVFLDLKFHDIPNTAAKAVSAAADLRVDDQCPCLRGQSYDECCQAGAGAEGQFDAAYWCHCIDQYG